MKLEKNFDRQLGVKLRIISVIIFAVLITISNFEINGQNETPAAEAINENYRIGSGDVIDVVVSKHDMLSRLGIRVSNQGMIKLPMLDGDIPAMCFTENELAALVTEKYKKYLLNPNVIVAVKEFNSTPVAVIGAVIAPARFQLQRPMRLMDALLLGNGPNAKAGPTVQIIRNNVVNSCFQNVTASDVPAEQLLSFNLSETLDGKDNSNPYIQAGDVVRVVEAEVVKIGQAFIIGNVKAARIIDLKDPVTLTQAIAMAGGTTSDAQIDKITIKRQLPDSLNNTEILVNLKEIRKSNKGDVLLQANDIIDVPGPTGTKKFFKDIFRTVITGVTRFPVPIP